MTAEIPHNQNMDNGEQGQPNPPEFAVDQLVKQLSVDHLSTVSTALDAIQKAALNSDNTNVRLKAITGLSNFAAIGPHLHPQNISGLKSAQARAREKIAAIAFGSDQEAVRLGAVLGLGKSLNIPATIGEGHQNTIQLIAIIASTTPNNDIKNAAIALLSNYSSRNRGIDMGIGGYYGSLVHEESQKYANRAIGVVSKPAPEANVPFPTPTATESPSPTPTLPPTS